jgi:hypothetical protein
MTWWARRTWQLARGTGRGRGACLLGSQAACAGEEPPVCSAGRRAWHCCRRRQAARAFGPRGGVEGGKESKGSLEWRLGVPRVKVWEVSYGQAAKY